MTLRKITEQRVAIKFCVAEGTFSDQTIKTLREAEIIFFFKLQGAGSQTKKDLMQKWKYGIDYM